MLDRDAPLAAQHGSWLSRSDRKLNVQPGDHITVLIFWVRREREGEITTRAAWGYAKCVSDFQSLVSWGFCRFQL
jgi:hypothetical protein